jgi:hypothetical protein
MGRRREDLVRDQEEPLCLRNGRFALRRDLAEKGGPDGVRAAFRDYYVARGLERIREHAEYFAPKVGVTAEGGRRA